MSQTHMLIHSAQRGRELVLQLKAGLVPAILPETSPGSSLHNRKRWPKLTAPEGGAFRVLSLPSRFWFLRRRYAET